MGELEKTYEGTSRVRDTKISHLYGKFENYKMQPNETIYEIHDMFINIINPLSVLGKNFTNLEINSKLLMSLPKDWEAKRTAIEEARDLSALSKEELLGAFKTHEIIKKQGEEGNKKDIALKATRQDLSDEKDDDEQEDLVSMANMFKKILRKSKKIEDDSSSSK